MNIAQLLMERLFVNELLREEFVDFTMRNIIEATLRA